MSIEQETIENAVTLFRKGEDADTFYFSVEGFVHLYYKVGDPNSGVLIDIQVY